MVSVVVAIKRDQIYGDYQAIDRLDAVKGLFLARCVRCGYERRYRSTRLVRGPKHDCESLTDLEEIAEIAQTLDTDDEETRSMFAEQVDTIKGLIDRLETQHIEGARKFQLVTLKTLVELIPFAERQFRNDPRQSNAYSLNALVSQARELMTDLDAKESGEALIERVLVQILQPIWLQIGEILINNVYAMKREVESQLEAKKVPRLMTFMDETLKSMGRQTEDLFYDAKKRISQELE